MEYFSKNFVSFITLFIVLLLFIERCNEKPAKPQEPVIVRDTVYVSLNGTQTSQPQLTSSIPIPISEITKEIKYLPDTNYNKLLDQYNKLLSLYFAKNIQNDTLKVDSIGSLYVTDTVSQNLVLKRTYDYDFKYPVITNTVTLPPTLRNQVYIGGGLEGNPTSLINQINAGLLFKNKKDQIIGGYVGLNKDVKFMYGVQTYWKIKIRK